MRGMSRPFAYLAFAISGVFAAWFVAGVTDAIVGVGLSEAAYTLTHWPAVTGTILLTVLAIFFLCLGMFLLPKD